MVLADATTTLSAPTVQSLHATWRDLHAREGRADRIIVAPNSTIADRAVAERDCLALRDRIRAIEAWALETKPATAADAGALLEIAAAVLDAEVSTLPEQTPAMQAAVIALWHAAALLKPARRKA